MHELSLMESVRDLALEQAAAHGASRIEVITLRIGSLAGVEPEALRFAREVVLAGTIAAGARLEIDAVPARYHCADCDSPYAAPTGLCECPRCGALGGRLLCGRELQLVSLQLT
jgi:hydrogenase nickel incorporation protein HypA/HybF